MIILEDEREITTEKICENCNLLKQGRYVQSVGFSQEDRGSYFICFDCFKPRLKWAKNEKSKIFLSPINCEAKKGML